MKRAIFLDRDGVINRLVYNPGERIYDSPYQIDQFELLPRSAAAVRAINELGFLAIVVSNQPGIAKRKCSPEFLVELTDRMQADLASQGARLDAVYYCLHHPEAVVSDYRADCNCRKPKPGLLLQAAEDFEIDLSQSFMVGDTDRDVGAGLQAGCRPVLVDAEMKNKQASLLVVPDLYEAIPIFRDQCDQNTRPARVGQDIKT